MGKFLVKIGYAVQMGWKKFQCYWNLVGSKFLFKTGDCPNKMCTCKK